MELILLVLFVVIVILYAVQRGSSPTTSPEAIAQISEIKARLALLDPSYASIPIYIDDSSYTINKKTIYLCLKDTNGTPYDINSLMRVTLHEMAHILTKSMEYDDKGKIVEHGPNFRKNFHSLIEESRRKGIYDPTKPFPTSYCGVTGPHGEHGAPGMEYLRYQR